jgi:tRNA-Thr(GGU) m(6)t(6)A37 methyltransferase TsaA
MMNTKHPVLKFIGEVRSSLKRLEDCPLQESENAPVADLFIFSEYLDAIDNILPGTEITIFTWLDKADRSILKCVPRNNYDSPMIGVFSTRSPDRPNPIGIHIANVISVSKEGVITVSNLEVLDGTPVIDIKPVLGSTRISR